MEGWPVVLAPPMTNAPRCAPAALVGDGKPVCLARRGSAICNTTLPAPLRPTLILLGVLEPFQLAADVDEHAGEFGSHGSKGHVSRAPWRQ